MGTAFDFEVRALELNSLYAWDFDWIKKTMTFLEDNGMNTLILHRNDFIDLIVYPGKYFGWEYRGEGNTMYDQYNSIFRKVYKYTPTRRSGPVQRRACFRRVLYEAKLRNIDVYVENKELYFPDYLLEFFPQLVQNGAVCANNPFWWEFTREKFGEFFAEFPSVAGIITSPGTGESRLAINSNRCTCELCRNSRKRDWYKNLLMAMYEPIHNAGKRLIVRDFVFKPEAQAELVEFMEDLPEDIVFSLKNTPHDYYPTFPENARIGQLRNHAQWIEFDAMGQYFGWGIGIADLTEDYRRRLESAKAKGVSGALFRTDWESLDGHSSFKSQNLINQYAAAALSQNLKTPAGDIYYNYLNRENGFEPKASLQQKIKAAEWLKDILSKTWPITAKTVYVQDCVFSDSSLTPLGLDHAYWLAEDKNSLRDWAPEKWDALSPTEANVKACLREKEEALEGISALYNQCAAGRPEAMNKTFYQKLLESLAINYRYVRFFTSAVRAVVFTRYLLETKESRGGSYYEEARRLHKEALDALPVLEEETRRFYRESEAVNHVVYTLMDPDRIAALYRNLKAEIRP
jgi:hypothetical protein